jgi:hypothetical protein
LCEPTWHLRGLKGEGRRSTRPLPLSDLREPAEAPPTAAVLLILVNWVSALLQLCSAFIL